MAVERAPGGSGSGFSQQFDWGQIASRTVSFTLETLSRLSAADVDPYSFEVGRLIGSQFELSQRGRRNVVSALSQLRSYGSLGDILWFGFGTKHVIRVMPSTDEGLTFLALSGVLADYNDDRVSPEVLHDMVRTFNAPPESIPSVLQWQALIQACAGVLARKSFGVLVD